MSRLDPQALRALLLVVGTVLLLVLANYAYSLYQQHRVGKAIEATVQHHTARVATEARPRQAFDSSFYTLAGRVQEATRHAILQQHTYDSLRRQLPPVVPQLPATPPRYRAGH